VRRVRRLLFERFDDHPLDLVIADRARPARTRLVVQPVEAALGEAAAPTAHGRAVAPKPGRDLLARLPVRSRQHNPAAQRQRLRAFFGRRAQRSSTSRSSSLSTTSARCGMTASYRRR